MARTRSSTSAFDLSEELFESVPPETKRSQKPKPDCPKKDAPAITVKPAPKHEASSSMDIAPKKERLQAQIPLELYKRLQYYKIERNIRTMSDVVEQLLTDALSRT